VEIREYTRPGTTILPSVLILKQVKNLLPIVFSAVSFGVMDNDVVRRVLEALKLNHPSFWRMMVNEYHAAMRFSINVIPILNEPDYVLTALELPLKLIVRWVLLIAD